MRRKILWITFWTTMAFWLGGGLGCAGEQNYKLLEDDPQRFHNESPTRSGPRDLSLAPAGAERLVLATATAAAPGRQTAPSLRGIDRSHWPKVTVYMPVGVVEHFPVYYRDYAPTDVKRALYVDWGCITGCWHQLEHDLGCDACAKAGAATQPAATAPAATSRAAATTAPAAPCAMAGDVFPARPPAPRGHRLLRDDLPADDAALREALSGEQARGWLNQNNRLNMLVQPLKFAVDTVLLPVRAIDNPPWTPVTTP